MLTKQAANNNNNRDHTKCETFLIAKERTKISYRIGKNLKSKSSKLLYKGSLYK